jgi:hypothetical protein
MMQFILEGENVKPHKKKELNRSIPRRKHEETNQRITYKTLG